MNNIDIMVVYLYLYWSGISKAQRARYIWRATFESDFLKGEEFHTAFGWSSKGQHIFPECVPSVAVLVPPSSSMAAVLKAHSYTVATKK